MNLYSEYRTRFKKWILIRNSFFYNLKSYYSSFRFINNMANIYLFNYIEILLINNILNHLMR